MTRLSESQDKLNTGNSIPARKMKTRGRGQTVRQKKLNERRLAGKFSLRQEIPGIGTNRYLSLINPCASRCLAQVSTAEASADEFVCVSSSFAAQVRLCLVSGWYILITKGGEEEQAVNINATTTNRFDKKSACRTYPISR